MTDRVAIVANSASGSSVDEEQLRTAWDDLDVETEWMPTTEQSPGTEQGARAAAGGVDTVVACGGDGTVRAVLEGVAGTSAHLGIVPLGTGNLLASNLDLPIGLDAVAISVSGIPRQLDVGVINGERFAVMAGVGLDAAMVGDANSTLKRHVGTLAYVVSAVKQMRSLRSQLFRADVVTDGDTWSGRSAMVLIGNCGGVSGGLTVFPEAEPDDGRLDVAIVTATSLRAWMSILSRMVFSRPQRADFVRRSSARHIVVRLDRPLPYELDGEVRPPARLLDVSVEPAAVSVRVGEPSSPSPSSPSPG